MKLLDGVDGTMRVRHYDKERNELELEVWGCSTCPFLRWIDRALGRKPFCPFDSHADIPKMRYEEDVPERFPENCPLRDPNFKLTRHLEEE